MKFTPDLNLHGERKDKKAGADSKKKMTKKERREKRKEHKRRQVHGEYMNVVEELADLQDWSISEQGAWGVPVPYFVRRRDGEVLGGAEVSRWVARIVEQKGSDAWFEKDVRELLPPGYDASEYEKGN